MDLITLENQSMEDLTKCFNEGFSDYAIKFEATVEYLTNRWTGSRVDLSISGGVMVFDKLVAIVIMAVDDKNGQLTAYNAATCTHPMYRRMGMISNLFEFLKPKWQSRGVEVVDLEVLQGNDAAISAYRKIGFEIDRDLNCYDLDLKNLAIHQGIEIQEVNEINMMANVSQWEMLPSWDFTNAFYQKRKHDLVAKTAILNGDVVGELVFDKKNKKLFYLFVDSTFRRQGIARGLLASLKPDVETIKIINVAAKNKGLISFVEKLGGTTLINQHEMKMTIA